MKEPPTNPCGQDHRPNKGTADSAPASGAVETDLPNGDFLEQAAFVLTLSTSGFHRHFLEGFLEKTGRLLSIRWWQVNAFLYLATAVASIAWLDMSRLFGRGGLISYGIGTVAEFVAGTFILYHLRESRALAFTTVPALKSGAYRLIWLRRHLAPMYWGWIIPRRGRRDKTTKRPLCLRVWHVVGLLLLAFYAAELFPTLLSASNGGWEHSIHHVVWFWPYLVKAVVIVAVVSHFWWLAGVVRVVRWAQLSALSRDQRQRLYLEGGRAALRLNVVLGIATGVWMLAHGYGHGITIWAWFGAVGLAVLFGAQTAILKGVSLFRWKSIEEWLTSISAVTTQTRSLYRPAELFALLGSIMCPVALNRLGQIAGRLSGG